MKILQQNEYMIQGLELNNRKNLENICKTSKLRRKIKLYYWAISRDNKNEERLKKKSNSKSIKIKEAWEEMIYKFRKF